jgi:pyroglutamyl-peptidase
MSRKSLLVAGFGAFPGQRINPAQIATEALARRRGAFSLSGINLHTAVLPVDHAELPPRLTKLFAETSPDAVLLLGVAARRKKLSVETRAKNRVTLLRADAAKQLAWSCEIVHGAPDQFESPAPAERLAACARACGVPAQISRDAGAYLCNEAYYLSLLMDRRAVFVHLPDWRRAEVSRGLPALESMAKALTFVQD